MPRAGRARRAGRWARGMAGAAWLAMAASRRRTAGDVWAKTAKTAKTAKQRTRSRSRSHGDQWWRRRSAWQARARHQAGQWRHQQERLRDAIGWLWLWLLVDERLADAWRARRRQWRAREPYTEPQRRRGPRNPDGTPYTGVVWEGEVVDVRYEDDPRASPRGPAALASPPRALDAAAVPSHAGGDMNEHNPTGAPQVQPTSILGPAMEQIAQLEHWEPVNESGTVTAGAVRQLLAELPGFLALCGKVLHTVVDKINDTVGQVDAGPQVLANTAVWFEGGSDALADVAVAWDAVHQDLVERMTSEDEKDAAWDWRAAHGQ